MAKKNSSEGRDFNTLRKLGYELEAPQDEFSYQPDSGSRTGGQIGKQEYGIDSDPDTVSRDSLQNARTDLTASSPAQPDEPIVTEGERSAIEESATMSDPDVSNLVEDRIARHAQLKDLGILVHVARGIVQIQGNVPSDASKLLMSEILEALPGVHGIRNELQVKLS